MLYSCNDEIPILRHKNLVVNRLYTMNDSFAVTETSHPRTIIDEIPMYLPILICS